MITPLDIENKKFAKQMVNGYNVDEVDEFLDEVMVDYEKLYKENRELKAENYKLRILPKDKVITIEEGKFGGSALILPWGGLDQTEYQMERFDLRRLMYYLRDYSGKV